MNYIDFKTAWIEQMSHREQIQSLAGKELLPSKIQSLTSGITNPKEKVLDVARQIAKKQLSDNLPSTTSHTIRKLSFPSI